AVAVHAAFFVDEQRESRPGRRAAALHDEKVGRLDPAAASGGERERERERARRSRPPHAGTATPPRRGSPAPSSSPSRRCTACTPPKNRLRSPKRTMSS